MWRLPRANQRRNRPILKLESRAARSAKDRRFATADDSLQTRRLQTAVPWQTAPVRSARFHRVVRSLRKPNAIGERLAVVGELQRVAVLAELLLSARLAVAAECHDALNLFASRAEPVESQRCLKRRR